MNPVCVLGPGCFSRQRAFETGLRGYVDKARLCLGCREAVGAQVRALPRDYVDLTLRARVHAHARNDDLVQPASVLTYVPLDEGCEAAARDIFWVLTCWDAVVRERAELAEIDYSGMREGHVVQRVARVIAHCLELLATTPPTWGYFDGIDAGPVERDGVYAIGQLCRCHRRAMGMLGLTDPVIRLPGPCPECGDAALQRREEGHWVTCRTCGYQVAYQEYPAMMLRSLAGVDG